MTHRLGALLAGLIAVAPAAFAFEPVLSSSARLTAERATPIDSFEAPVAGFDGRIVPTVTVEGVIQRRAWRIDSAGLTSLQVMTPLREQLQSEGFAVQFECDARACGGFDFRFNTEVLPGPNMYVNITRYRYLTAVLGDPEAPSEVVGVLVSVTAGAAYVQIITANTEREDIAADTRIEPSEPTAAVVPVAGADSLEAVLLAQGHVILDDLEFETGTSALGPGPYASLEQLARLLASQTELRVALVGHTDTVGALETNIALSRARAASVRERLISEFEADPTRLEAEGMGYLSPITVNLTEEGRRLNRRVEAILLNVQ